MTDITNVTVLGSGVLGAQIAFQSAYAGFQVVAYDINDDAVAADTKRFDKLGEAYIRDLEDATQDTVAAARDRLTQSSDLEQAVSQADLVIEAVPERLDLKKEIWAKVGKAAPEHTIFATNTSTLLPSDFAEDSGRVDKFLALHFANHIWRYRTAEVMRTPKTSDEAFQTVLDYASEMGMIPVALNKEQPGYVLNSLLVPFLEAGQRLVVRGVASPEDIDADWENSTGAPAGPFRILDSIGLRTVAAIAHKNAEETNDEELRSFATLIEEEYLAKGRTGAESGEGFYRYDENGQLLKD